MNIEGNARVVAALAFMIGCTCICTAASCEQNSDEVSKNDGATRSSADAAADTPQFSGPNSAAASSEELHSVTRKNNKISLVKPTTTRCGDQCMNGQRLKSFTRQPKWKTVAKPVLKSIIGISKWSTRKMPLELESGERGSNFVPKKIQGSDYVYISQ